MESRYRTHAHRRAGFTLIEIMIVIAILGVLMATLGGSMRDTSRFASVDATRLTMGKIEQAVSIYAARNSNRYPTTSQGLSAAEAYMPDGEVPTDAWGNAFLYVSPAPRGDAPFEILSLGEDGLPGGADFNADLSSTEAPQG